MRIAIFMHWDKDNIVDDYVIEYIRGLREVCYEIIFVSNNLDLPNVEQKKVSKFCHEVFTRENKGLDFGAWKYVLELKGYDYFKEYDELILANDSCFAPLFPFFEMFDEMNKKECDFWGVTKHLAANASFGFVPEHLQSYFLLFKSIVFNSEHFKNFFIDVDSGNSSYHDVVLNYETQLTKKMKEVGFKEDVYINYHDILSKREMTKINKYGLYNLSILFGDRLIHNRSPFLKRKWISYHIGKAQVQVRNGFSYWKLNLIVFKIFKFNSLLDSNDSIYDYKLIESNIKRTFEKSSWRFLNAKRWYVFRFIISIPARNINRFKNKLFIFSQKFKNLSSIK